MDTINNTQRHQNNNNNNQCDLDDDTGVIHKFYENAVILITGGTGFIGKVLIEKLLRTFPIQKIYLLIRSKNNLSPTDRLQEFFKESIFSRIRNELPDVLSKVIPVSAEFDEPDLSIDQKLKTEIEGQVEIVFNIVASVKFNEKLRDAIEINVVGTKKILNLVMGMKHLKSFLHISTLYSNCHRKNIGEKVYEQELGYEKIVELLRTTDDVALETMKSDLIDDMPNTYTMTKRYSEALVNHQAHCLPAGIFRPPIVLSTYKEPFPGWTDNLYGPSGICAGVARGVVHAIYGNGQKMANLVPADYCVNAMIASAWDIQQQYTLRMINQTEMPVYNYIYNENNLTWDRYMTLVRQGLHEPFDKAVWYYSYTIISSEFLYKLANLICHTIPGYLLDSIAIITGKKRIYSKGYEKLNRIISMMSYFGLKDWQVENDNIHRLSTTISAQTTTQKQCHSNLHHNHHQNHHKKKQDNKCLEFDMKTIDWNEYFQFYLPGIKKYFFKENGSVKSRQHYQRLRILHMLMKSTFWLLFSSSSFVILWKWINFLMLFR